MTPFPKVKKRRLGFARRVAVSAVESIYCSCRMPDSGTRYIECIGCLDWFHVECVSLAKNASYRDVKWKCPDCINFFNSILKT